MTFATAQYILISQDTLTYFISFISQLCEVNGRSIASKSWWTWGSKDVNIIYKRSYSSSELMGKKPQAFKLQVQSFYFFKNLIIHTLTEHLLCAWNYSQHIKMNKIWFLPVKNLIDLWEQREHILENKFYQREKNLHLGTFPKCMKVPTYQRVVFQHFKGNYELRLLGAYSLHPFFYLVLNRVPRTKSAWSQQSQARDSESWRIPFFLLFIWIIQLSNSYICMQYL